MFVGLVVNPIAGMGGKVGLKGTDDVLQRAVTLGAEPVAPGRAIEFLLRLRKTMEKGKIRIITCPRTMGQTEAEAAGLSVQLLPMKVPRRTSARDTRRAVRLLTDANANLIVFVGGDGTARDVYEAMEGCKSIPVLGVPSGVKMYSSIFAVNPVDAADLVLAFARNDAELDEFEIVDADEEAVRNDVFKVKIHGFLKGPFIPIYMQGSKQLSPETTDEKENQVAIARYLLEQVPADGMLILGPGTTVKRVAETLGLRKTVLGVDILKNGKTILDVDEKRILREATDWQKTFVIVSPIGRQGILFGRGNQPISPRVIKQVGKNHILVVATKGKLLSIENSVLRVDTGNQRVDKTLRGYIKVLTDYREWRLMPVQ